MPCIEYLKYIALLLKDELIEEGRPAVERLAEATRRALGFRFPVTFQTVKVHYSLFLSVKIFKKSPLSPGLPPRSISSDMSISLPIIPSHSASSANSTPRNQPVDLPSPTSEAVQEDEAESNSNSNQLPSQSSEHSSDACILASHTPHSPKKPVDTQFTAHMAHIRRQITNSTGSTPRDSLILRISDTSLSDTFSESLSSVASFSPVVEFPPTPVFKDEIPEGIMERVKVASARLFSSTRRGPFIDVPVASISECCCSICQRGELLEVEKYDKADGRLFI